MTGADEINEAIDKLNDVLDAEDASDKLREEIAAFRMKIADIFARSCVAYLIGMRSDMYWQTYTAWHN